MRVLNLMHGGRRVLGLFVLGLAACVPRGSSAVPPSIIVIPAAALAGRGLAPHAVVSHGAIETLEPPSHPRIASVYEGSFLVGVYQGDDGTSHSTSFPGDELVLVLSGEATLTSDASAKPQVFRRGERFLVPRGWRGIWKNSKAYRELVTVSRAWLPFLSGNPLPKSESSTAEPVRFAPPTEWTATPALDQTFWQGEFRIRGTRNLSLIQETCGSRDQFVQVLQGRLSIRRADTTTTLKSGGAAILRTGDACALAASPDFRALVVID